MKNQIKSNQIKSKRLNQLLNDYQINDIENHIKSINDIIFDIKSIQINKIRINDMIDDFNYYSLIDFINKYSLYIISFENIEKIKKSIKKSNRIEYINRIMRNRLNQEYKILINKYKLYENQYYKIDRILIDKNLSTYNYIYLSKYKRIIKDMIKDIKSEMKYLYEISREYMMTK